ncbi:N-acetyl-gamma-glutamyl-phosphate reductase [Mycoavidus sp. B2-EB]|uniref:N-acetyl-gamma-glutamyl-phosphate reductase n=1 Tax=Mycoavidus sp. B2-EB TaxID=2651972 RepID=UPI0016254A5E|nr:N-acetyl-gamma-glutamyl-phosphate reductase [Mycoavidus sp. B2-EB]BBO58984.1 N-acetyl-gamma-glutamyl-phosphate reductase [Mycoavidus sp. B2-EB]
MIKVFVDGQEGTTGLKIFEYLAARSEIEILRIDEDKRKDVAQRRALINASDLTFLCLPDTAARESVTLVDNPDTCIIDASTAFRTHNDWAYGLPELNPAQRSRIRTAQRIAVPGCHASAFILSVHPLIAKGVMPPDCPLSSHSITGYSGGGKQMIAAYEQGENPLLASPRPYALGLEHKHLPEMTVHTGLAAAPIFTPIVASFYQGLAVSTCFYSRHLARGVGPQHIQAVLAEYYENEPFICVAPFDHAANLDEGFFNVQASNHTNRVDLFVFGNQDRIILIARLDNLGKGASGAALQCMNLRLGVNEMTGLKA